MAPVVQGTHFYIKKCCWGVKARLSAQGYNKVCAEQTDARHHLGRNFESADLILDHSAVPFYLYVSIMVLVTGGILVTAELSRKATDSKRSLSTPSIAAVS